VPGREREQGGGGRKQGRAENRNAADGQIVGGFRHMTRFQHRLRQAPPAAYGCRRRQGGASEAAAASGSVSLTARKALASACKHSNMAGKWAISDETSAPPMGLYHVADGEI
jgi:hypothetical protein